jgi:midasin
MSLGSTLQDPLTINLQRQTRALISKLPVGSPYTTTLLNVSSYTELSTTLSYLLTVPSLTLCIATIFRPILFDLCARWLQSDGHSELEAQLVALCLLLEPHEELFP